MRGEWKVTSNYLAGKIGYAVFRLRDINAIDHSGNREYANGYIDSEEECLILADKLNKKEGIDNE